MQAILIRCSLPAHPAIELISSRTGQSINATIGALVRFWTHARTASEGGLLRGADFPAIDRLTECDGFSESLVSLGWIEADSEGVRVVGFEQWTGEDAILTACDDIRDRRKKEATRARVQKHRRKSDSSVSEDVTQNSVTSDSVANVDVVTQNSVTSLLEQGSDVTQNSVTSNDDQSFVTQNSVTSVKPLSDVTQNSVTWQRAGNPDTLSPSVPSLPPVPFPFPSLDSPKPNTLPHPHNPTNPTPHCLEDNQRPKKEEKNKTNTKRKPKDPQGRACDPWDSATPPAPGTLFGDVSDPTPDSTPPKGCWGTKPPIWFDPINGAFVGITAKHRELWATAFPAIAGTEAKLTQFLAKLALWCIANPRPGDGKKINYLKAIGVWLGMAQEKADRSWKGGPDFAQSARPAKQTVEERLREMDALDDA